MNELGPNLLLGSIGVPLLAGILLLAYRNLPAWVVRIVVWIGFGLPLVAALTLWCQYAPETPGGYDFVSQYSTGLEALGISLHLGLNGVALPLFILAAVVGLAAGLYAASSDAERLPYYLGLLLIMQAGLMGVFASIDIFFFYLFHELALIPTFIMIGVWGGRDRHYAAMKMTIYLTLGAMLSLAGLIVLYVKSGADSFDLIALREALALQPLAATVQHYAFGLLLFGFGILVSLFPFHTWAPLGYGAAPSSTAMLHAGVLKKFGLYGLIQIAVPLMPAGMPGWAPLLCWLALGNVIVIGLITLAQRDLKQMIGYSSVMHMGYAFLGIAALSVLGAGGVILLMVAHGLTVALLFLLATCVYHRSQTFDLGEMGGLVKKTPVLAGFFTFAVLASIGVPGPGLANFWGEFIIFLAVWDYQAITAALLVVGIIISAVYGLRAVAMIFLGRPTESFRATLDGEIKDLAWSERLPALLLIIALLGIGLWPRSLTDAANASLEANYQLPTLVAEVTEP
jgi:NADH-quinone oxidoreductase subunit M